jgi:hypothetical protein
MNRAREHAAKIEKAHAMFRQVNWAKRARSRKWANSWAHHVHALLDNFMCKAGADVPALQGHNIAGTLDQLDKRRATPAAERGPVVVVVGNCPAVNHESGLQSTYGDPRCDAVSARAMRVRRAMMCESLFGGNRHSALCHWLKEKTISHLPKTKQALGGSVNGANGVFFATDALARHPGARRVAGKTADGRYVLKDSDDDGGSSSADSDSTASGGAGSGNSDDDDSDSTGSDDTDSNSSDDDDDDDDDDCPDPSD